MNAIGTPDGYDVAIVGAGPAGLSAALFLGRCRRQVRGSDLPRAALFFATSQRQRSSLARRIGCELTPEGAVATDEPESACVPGVNVAGDASHREQKVVVAAAEGAQAAIKMHESLWTEELRGGLADRSPLEKRTGHETRE